MNVALVHHSLSASGGMERYLGDLLSGFAAAGDEVVIAAPPPREPRLPPGVTLEPLPFARWLPRALKFRVFARRAEAWIREQTARGVPVIGLTRVAGTTLAICGGTHRGHVARRGRPADPGDWLELRRERRTYATAQAVLAHSRLLKGELLTGYDLAPAKVPVLYPPVDTMRFRLEHRRRRAELRAKFGLAAGPKYLLFPSGSHRRKGWDLVRAAVAELPAGEYQVLVAGAPLPGRAPEGVRYLGRIAAMEELYAAVDVTVMPSRYEPFGLVYVESVLCGTPVVLPADAGAAEVLPAATAVLLTERNPAALAAAIGRAANLPPIADLSFVETYRLSVAAHVAALRDLLAGLR